MKEIGFGIFPDMSGPRNNIQTRLVNTLGLVNLCQICVKFAQDNADTLPLSTVSLNDVLWILDKEFILLAKCGTCF